MSVFHLNDIHPNLPEQHDSSVVSCAAVAIDANALADWLGCPPSQDASHHQDYYIFRIGDPYKPSFATVTGRGDNPTDWSHFFFVHLNVLFSFYTHLTRLPPNGQVKQHVFLLQIDKLPPSLMITLNDDHKVRSVYSVVDFKGKRCPQQQNVKT